MRIGIFLDEHKPHHLQIMSLVIDGLKRHGVKHSVYSYNELVFCDLAIFWSTRCKMAHYQFKRGMNYLCLENPFLGRSTLRKSSLSWVSAGLNGLNGRAKFIDSQDNGERFESLWGHLYGDWKGQINSKAVIMGQVPNDKSLDFVNYYSWVKSQVNKLKKLGFEVYFRPHPISPNDPIISQIDGVSFLDPRGPLDTVFNMGAFIITLNSNSGVDSLLNGSVTYAQDIGSMLISPNFGNNVSCNVNKPNSFHIEPKGRRNFFKKLSWNQWCINEISSGLMWDYLTSDQEGLIHD